MGCKAPLDGSTASQQIPCILWNPNPHKRIHKSSALFPIVSQVNSARPPSTLHSVYSISILVVVSNLHSGLSKWSVSLECSQPKPRMHLSSRPFVPHSPPILIFDRQNSVWRSLETMTFLVLQFEPKSSSSSGWNKTTTYLLTHSMVQSPSWTANRFAASQEIPRI